MTHRRLHHENNSDHAREPDDVEQRSRRRAAGQAAHDIPHHSDHPQHEQLGDHETRLAAEQQHREGGSHRDEEAGPALRLERDARLDVELAAADQPGGEPEAT